MSEGSFSISHNNLLAEEELTVQIVKSFTEYLEKNLDLKSLTQSELEREISDCEKRLNCVVKIPSSALMFQWSNENECFVVSFPEFEDVMQPVTHGDTYEEAIKNAQEVLKLLI